MISKAYNIPDLRRSFLEKILRDTAPSTANLVATWYSSVTAFSHQVQVFFPFSFL
jgi:hypothetical protein